MLGAVSGDFALTEWDGEAVGDGLEAEVGEAGLAAAAAAEPAPAG